MTACILAVWSFGDLAASMTLPNTSGGDRMDLERFWTTARPRPPHKAFELFEFMELRTLHSSHTRETSGFADCHAEEDVLERDALELHNLMGWLESFPGYATSSGTT